MSEFIKAVRVLGFWRTMWARTGYRPFMRWAHRLGWHHAPRNPFLTNDAGWALHRCSWCGLSDFVATKEDLQRGPLMQVADDAAIAGTSRNRDAPHP